MIASGAAAQPARWFAGAIYPAFLGPFLAIFGQLAMAQTGANPPQASPSAPQYQDRVMAVQPADAAQDEVKSTYDSAGLPRAWSLETFADQRTAAGLPTSSLGLRANGYADTLHYGTLSGNVNLQNRNAGASTTSSTDSTFILRQIGMPFDGGWRLDNTLGMTNLPVLEMARNSQRITLTTPSMQGLNSQARQGALSVVAAIGQAGQMQGYPAAGFTVTQGNYAMAGLQNQLRRADGSWQWGAMVAQAQDVSSVLALTPTGQGRLDAQAVYLSARREWANPQSAESTYVQGNMVGSRNTGFDIAGLLNAPANGAWVEGGFSYAAHRDNWGIFRLDPGLGWLDLPMANDLQGAYWRHAWRTRQWSVETGLELLDSLSGTTPGGYFANGNARYQYSLATSFGASVSVRRYGVQAQSLQLYTQFANELGSSRAQVEMASADTGERLVRLQLDHDWTQLEALRLTTALSVDREFRPAGDSQGFGTAVNADWSIGRSLTLNQSLQGRWASGQSQYTLNAGLNWRLAPQWSLQTNVYAIQGTADLQSLAQSPLQTPPVLPVNTNDSGLFVMLRYDESAGQARAPVGGAPGSAAGRLTGSVFLDDNQNGKREAGEQGAANVTVLLDGRYAMQTDAQGRFEFAYIAAGAHVLTVISDNLPLPWGLEKEGRTEVRVFTRDTTTVNIGAIRQ